MKFSKYLAGCILIIAMTILLTIFNVNILPSSIPNSFRVSCEGVENIDYAVWNEAAQRHNIVLCAVSDHDTAIQKKECTYYVDERQSAFFRNHCLGVRSGMQEDFLGNQCVLNYESFDKLLRDSKLQKSIQNCLLFGNEQDCRAWIREIEVPGQTLYIQDQKPDETAILPFLAFGLILLLLLFYCYLDASFQKKEIAIRVLHGDSPLYHYVCFSLTDTVFFSVLLIAAFLIQDTVAPLINFYQKVWLLGIPFIIAIWLVNLQLLFICPKEMLYGHQLSKNLMVMLHSLGVVSAVVTCAVMLSATAELPSLQKYRKANDFFSQHTEYEFADLYFDDALWNQMQYDPSIEETADRAAREFYQKTESVLQPICIQRVTNLLDDLETAPDIEVIYCNFRALPYIQSICPDAVQCDLQAYDAVMLIPDSATEDEIALAKYLLTDRYQSVERIELKSDALQQIVYRSTEEVICFEEYKDSRFMFCKEPFVLLTAEREPEADQGRNLDNLSRGSIYMHTDEQELRPFLENIPVRFVRTNVYTQFQKEYETHKKLTKTALCLGAMIICLYMFIVHTILLLDYKVNAIELSVKKVLGWSVLQKNKKHFVIATCIFAVNLCIAAAYAYHSQIQQGILLCLVPMVLYAANLMLLCGLIHRIERKSLIKILKGGSL